MTVNQAVSSLICYGREKGFLDELDTAYTANQLLDVLRLESWSFEPLSPLPCLEEILRTLLDDAARRGLLTFDSTLYRDLLDTKLMNCLTPRPSQVIRHFFHLYQQSPKAATDCYYQLCQDTDYIRTYRIARDIKWTVESEYGALDITINLSKPEKDPKAIAAAGKLLSSDYPKCQLCHENEGYGGRADHPARGTLRTIPITLCGSQWYFQYSPYVYYNEHCIVFNGEHTPMKIHRGTFERLFDFIGQFPHYVLGSNADLPIVGGSILSHDHFQGGNYMFPMARAGIETPIAFQQFPQVSAGIVKWPMSVLRLSSRDTAPLVELGERILNAWKGYSDPKVMILAQTQGIPHNTITPIARKNGENFELDLVFRNNLTTKEHPDGLYHPHREHHHIKKENIGLIEVMGLAILPARLKDELSRLANALLAGEDISAIPSIAKHGPWALSLRGKYPDMNRQNIDAILRQEVGLVFLDILAQAGVFKRTREGQNAFIKFLSSIQA